MGKKKFSKNDSSVMGGAVGTLIVLLAQNLPETSIWKQWLVFVAPLISVRLNSFCSWTSRKIEEYFDTKELNAAVKETKITIEEALNNNATSEAHKNRLRKKLEQSEILTVEAKLKRVEILAK